MTKGTDDSTQVVAGRVLKLLAAALTFACLSVGFAQPEPATVSCDASKDVLVIQPGKSSPPPGGTILRVQFFVWNWNGAAWVAGGWTEAFDYDGWADTYQPVEIRVTSGYHRVTTRYQWLSDVVPQSPEDVETNVYLQLSPADVSQSPIQVPSDQLPPQLSESNYCYTY